VRSYPSCVKDNLLRSLLLALVLGASSVGQTQPLQTIPIEQIKPGMTGYGLSVFSGFKVERFKVRVIDVIRNFLPKQDLFLITTDHPVLQKTGVVGGMSGSPIYLDGKLAGALAYGWRFSKDPICGVTPIKHMLDLMQRKPRGPSTLTWASAQRRTPADRAALASLSSAQRWWRLPFPRPAAPSTTSLTPVAVPLNVAGFAPETVSEIKKAFASYGFEPVQGGGTGKVEGPDKFELGGAVAVQMISGDMNLAGTGTVTHIDGNRLLAFGHKMFNAGEIYIPAATARIHHTLASIQRSFKIASPARVIGSLVQDRQAGIMIDTKQALSTTPMTVTVRSQGQTRVFRAQLARHRLLTTTLASSVLTSALSEALSDVDHTTFKVTSRIAVRGFKPLRLEDNLYAAGGVVLTTVIFSRGIRAMREVLNNDFQPAHIDRVDIEVDARFAVDVAEIVAVSVNQTTVNPGSRINIMVTFRPFAGGEYTKAYPLEIPSTLAGSVINVEVASGVQVRPDRAPPQNLRQFLEDLQDGYPSRAVVISLETPYEGLKLRGHVLRDLPSSVIDSLSTSSQIRQEQTFQRALRHVHGTQKVIVGHKSIRIRVRSEVNP
jgi:hypothetical protein